jgi:SAM-dependent methyltransferase
MKLRTRPDAPEDNSGLRSLLQFPWIYEAFQRVVGKNKLRRRFVDEFVRSEPHHRTLDIGCGPGDLVPFIEPAAYVGFDINADYIAAARSRFGHRASFFDGTLDDLFPQMASSFDTCVAIGVLHHVPDDIAIEIAQGAREALVAGGAFIALEPHLYEGQHWIAAALIKRDRGQFVRSESGYLQILEKVFDSVEVVRDEKMLRVPYTTSIYLCR